jgi:DNA-directed RNA polymerase specialized sigma24 family protein
MTPEDLDGRLRNWLEQHWGVLLGRLRRLASYADAVDALHESLTELWPRLGTEFVILEDGGRLYVSCDNGPASLVNFIARRATHRLMDALRGRQLDARVKRGLSAEEQPACPGPEPPADPAHRVALREAIFDCACGLSLDYRCALLDRLTQTPDEVWVPEADALRQRLAETLAETDLERWRQQPESTRRTHRRRAGLALRECLLARGTAFRDLLPDVERLAPRPAARGGRTDS